MDSILTIRDMAEFLKMNERTVLRMAQTGAIPAAKIGSQWRFKRELIDRWLDTKMLGTDKGMPSKSVRAAPLFPPLTELMDGCLIRLNLKASNKTEVLTHLVEPLVEAGYLANGDELLSRLVERERLMTTALGDGVAFPHPRKPQEGPFDTARLVIGVSQHGVDYEALDGKPVHVFFLICAPDDSTHLRIMAQLTRTVRGVDVVGRLLKAKSGEEVVALFHEWDQQLSGSPRLRGEERLQ
jgi:PTS system nitrogen regulatory IIA component